MYGHTARVWKVRAVEGSNFVVTCSEDTTVRLWDIETGSEVRLMQGMSPLAGKNVRGLAVYDGLIATGAEDSGVRLFTPSQTLTSKSIRVPLPGQDQIHTDLLKPGKVSDKQKQLHSIVKCVHCYDVVSCLAGTSKG